MAVLQLGFNDAHEAVLIIEFVYPGSYFIDADLRCEGSRPAAFEACLEGMTPCFEFACREQIFDAHCTALFRQPLDGSVGGKDEAAIAPVAVDLRQCRFGKVGLFLFAKQRPGSDGLGDFALNGGDTNQSLSDAMCGALIVSNLKDLTGTIGGQELAQSASGMMVAKRGGGLNQLNGIDMSAVFEAQTANGFARLKATIRINIGFKQHHVAKLCKGTHELGHRRMVFVLDGCAAISFDGLELQSIEANIIRAGAFEATKEGAAAGRFEFEFAGERLVVQ